MADTTSLISAYGTLMSMSRAVVKDTVLSKVKFKITGSADAKEFAEVLERKFGMSNLESIVKLDETPWTNMKTDLKEYSVYFHVVFGTELEDITEFDAKGVSATFTHTIKDTGDGVEENTTCTIEMLKNDDEIDGRIAPYIKYKELNPQTGKKVLVPMKFEITKIDSDPVVMTSIEAEVEGEVD